ncbi:serine/threonine-protein kinase [Streptomyces sp. NPDC048441]|uniref:serine/threonine-protein kinase n=1 Tax=Streptomyces sp. NPDC048441 TaxID=3365552 RepID=UPI00371C9374
MVEADGASSRLIGGRYALGEVLGRGGMGIVRAAQDQVLRRTVAVKQLVAPLGLEPTDEHALTVRFLREARSAASLDHPSIVSVYDVVEDTEGTWMVMQFVKGRSLHTVLQQEGALPVGRVAEIGLALLSALGCAHGEGIIHRDLKPGNVLVADDGRTLLTDFGIAAALDATALTRTGQVIGTPGFIAPERVMGAQGGPLSDLWSLGVTLYAGVEGHSAHGEPPQRAGMLEPVLKGLMQQDPNERWTSPQARAYLESLTDTDSGSMLPATRRQTGASGEPVRNKPVSAQEPQPPSEASRDTPRSTSKTARPVVLSSVIAVLALALGTSLLMNLRDDGGSSSDKPTTPKSVAVPDLCEPLWKNPNMKDWVPHARKVPTATLPSGKQSSRTCQFMGKVNDYDHDLTVSVVGYQDTKTASARLMSKVRAAKAEKTYTDEDHGAQGPKGLGKEAYYNYDEQALVLFRVGPYVAKVTYDDDTSSPYLYAEEIAPWVYRQLEDATAGSN